MHAKDLSNLDLPSFDLHPSATGFHEHKRCFKHCLTDLKQPYLSYEEESCARNCLSKYVQAGIFLSQKMTHNLTQLVTQDPKIKIAFSKQAKQTHPE